MSKYIDKDLLKSELKNLHESERLEYLGVFDTINSMPKADVTEVKHGKWIDVPLNMDPNDFAYKYNLRTKCSVCDYAMPREYPYFKICPNCGARMDGE